MFSRLLRPGPSLRFSGQLSRAAPDRKAMAGIERTGGALRLAVDCLDERVPEPEQLPDRYGTVAAGNLSPEKFTKEAALALDIRNRFLIATTRFEMRRNAQEGDPEILGDESGQEEDYLSILKRDENTARLFQYMEKAVRGV
jgi:hypothetical protein